LIVTLVFLGGGVGSVARYLLGQFIQSRSHSAFPLGTLMVNILGCIAIGLITRLFFHAQTEQLARAALVIGFCGGFTTFSTFSIEVAGLVEAGALLRASVYIAASVVSCIIGTMVALRLGPTLNR
jgi:CrcB protein